MRRNQNLGAGIMRALKEIAAIIFMQARINLFVAWFLLSQTLAMGWVAAVGRALLAALGVETQEEDIPARIVGALLLFGAVFLVQHFRGSLPPDGRPEGSGFRSGHRFVLVANLLAIMLFVFPFFHHFIERPDVVMVLSKIAIASGYIAVAGWAVGFSLVYQSTLLKK